MTYRNTEYIREFDIDSPNRTTVNKLLLQIRRIINSKTIDYQEKLYSIDKITLQLRKFEYNNIPRNFQTRYRKLYRILRHDEDPRFGLVSKDPRAILPSYTVHLWGTQQNTRFLSFYPSMEAALYQVYKSLRAPRNINEKHNVDIDNFRIIEVDAASVIGKIIDLTSLPGLMKDAIGVPKAFRNLKCSREVTVIGFVPRNAVVYNMYHLSCRTRIFRYTNNILNDIKNVDLTTQKHFKDLKARKFERAIGQRRSNLLTNIMSLKQPIDVQRPNVIDDVKALQNPPNEELREVQDHINTPSFVEGGHIKFINTDDVFINSSNDKTIDDISIEDIIFVMNWGSSINSAYALFTLWMTDEDKEKYIVSKIRDMNCCYKSKYSDDNICDEGNNKNNYFCNDDESNYDTNKTNNINKRNHNICVSKNNENINCNVTTDNINVKNNDNNNTIIENIKQGNKNYEPGGLTFKVQKINDDIMNLVLVNDNDVKSLKIDVTSYYVPNIFKLKLDLFAYDTHNDKYRHIHTFNMNALSDKECHDINNHDLKIKDYLLKHSFVYEDSHKKLIEYLSRLDNDCR